MSLVHAFIGLSLWLCVSVSVLPVLLCYYGFIPDSNKWNGMEYRLSLAYNINDHNKFWITASVGQRRSKSNTVVRAIPLIVQLHSTTRCAIVGLIAVLYDCACCSSSQLVRSVSWFSYSISSSINQLTIYLLRITLSVVFNTCGFMFDFTFLYFFVCCLLLFCSFCHIVLYIIATHCFIIIL